MLDAFKMAGTLAGLMKNKEAIRASADRVKAKLAEVRATGTAGGGAVTVIASGQLKVLRVELSPALAAHMTADAASRAAAESLIAEAVNAAIGQAQARAHQEIAKEAEALGIPNIPGLEGMLGAPSMDTPRAGFQAMPGVDAIDAWRPADALRIVISAGKATPTYSVEEESRWRDLCAANPRVHNGPILAVDTIDHATSTYTCRRDQYKHLAVQPRHIPPPAGVWILGVKGWITARDKSGAEHLLIARRGAQTRVYADLWESAPAGGVDPPRDAVTELSVTALAETLAVEAEEELGMDLDTRGAKVVGVCRDFTAGSDDIFIAVELKDPIDPRHSPSCQHGRCGWEYSDTAWLSRADARAFDARKTPTMVPPTRAILRLMGWIT